MQKQDTNVSALMVSISKLQTENERLKKEIEELQAKVAASMTTKGALTCSVCTDKTKTKSVKDK